MSYQYKGIRTEEYDDIIDAANALCEGGSGWRIIHIENFGHWWYATAERLESHQPEKDDEGKLPWQKNLTSPTSPLADTKSNP